MGCEEKVKQTVKILIILDNCCFFTSFFYLPSFKKRVNELMPTLLSELSTIDGCALWLAFL